MTTLLNWEITLSLAFALPTISVTAQTLHTLHEKIKKFFTQRCIFRIATMVVSQYDPCDKDIYALRRNFTAATILNSLIFISEHIHGIATNRLILIVEVCELERELALLLKRACRVGALHHISRLVQLAPSASTIEKTTISLNNAHSRAQLHTAMGQIASYPQRAIRCLTRIDIPLTIYEVAIFAKLLYRVGVPIAYTPMLTSQNHNLQLIGIYLAESFSAVDAELYLQQLASSHDYEVAHAALYALCAIRGNIASELSSCAIKQLTPLHRAAFLRHAVQSCYSLSSCAQLLTKVERTQFAQRIDSYKCRIVCN